MNPSVDTPSMIPPSMPPARDPSDPDADTTVARRPGVRRDGRPIPYRVRFPFRPWAVSVPGEKVRTFATRKAAEDYAGRRAYDHGPDAAWIIVTKTETTYAAVWHAGWDGNVESEGWIPARSSAAIDTAAEPS